MDGIRNRSAARSVFLTLLACLLSIAMVPTFAVPAYAADPEVSGGSDITASGTYQIASDATGVITVGENLNVTLKGNGTDAISTPNSDLLIQVGDGSTLALESVFISNTTTTAIDVLGKVTINSVGKNIIDGSTDYASFAVIDVRAGDEVTFNGTDDGPFYLYKKAQGSGIGGPANTQSGKINFVGGNYFIKGTQTGAVIGNDSTDAPAGDITISGGRLYVEANARGAAIGGSSMGMPGKVKIAGGQVYIWCDWEGSAIGKGGRGEVGSGTLEVTGGTLKTIVGKNAGAIWGTSTTEPTVTSNVITAEKSNGAEEEVTLLTFDASAYEESGTITAAVDGTPFYTGDLYGYGFVPDTTYTPGNWPVDTSDTNLYFYVTKANHKITVGSDIYNYRWDTSTNSFVFTGTESTIWDGTVDVSWYNTTDTTFTLSTPAQLAGLAAIVAGSYNPGAVVVGNPEYIVDNVVDEGTVDEYHYGLDDFKGKTIRLAADLDMGGVYDEGTDTWSGPNYMPIGGQYCMDITDSTTKLSASFNGTFDGQGHTVSNIYSNRRTDFSFSYSQSIGLIGRLGVHDSDPVETRSSNCAVRNVAVDGYIYGGRSVGGIVGKFGKTDGGATVENCVNNANVVSTDAKGVGGIVGSSWNGGSISNCYNTGTIAGGSPAGGICGSNEITVKNCYNVGTITSSNGANYAMGIGSQNYPSSTFISCYWLAGASAGGGIYQSTVIDCAEKTADELKAPAMLDLLNADKAFVADTENINNGYPILAWQSDEVKSLQIATLSTIDRQLYTGSAIEPEFTVTYKGEALVKGDDYTVTYADNTEKGTATLTIEGIAPYIGVITRTFDIFKAEVNEIAGENRYATAAEEALTAYPDGSEGVIIATGVSFPDALSVAGLAGMLDYPILLTDPNKLSSETEAAIEQLDPTEIITVGGTSAVSASVQYNLGYLVGYKNLTRLSGSDRFETALAIYDFGKEADGWSDTAIVATGMGFADALSISSYAAASESPIFLTDASGNLTNAVKAEIIADTAEIDNAVVVGGTGVVSAATEAWLAEEAATADTTERLSGDTRYDTSYAIAKWAVDNGMTADNAGIATGRNYPDALAGGPMLAKTGSVLLLANEGNTQAFELLSENKGSVEVINFLGGVGAVTPAVRTAALDALGWPSSLL